MRHLTDIPGVGRRMAPKIRDLGFPSVESLRGADPLDMYERYQASVGAPVDRCVLYVFRCAVYFASETQHDPELLKWWNWKSRALPAEKR